MRWDGVSDGSGCLVLQAALRFVYIGNHRRKHQPTNFSIPFRLVDGAYDIQCLNWTPNRNLIVAHAALAFESLNHCVASPSLLGARARLASIMKVLSKLSLAAA